MKKIVLIIMILTIISKFIGFGRELVLSYFYGASGISDAYLISTTIPTVVFAFIGMGIATSYIPIYSNIAEHTGIKQADLFTSKLANLLLVLCTLVVILVLIFTNSIVKMFASGFEGETLNLAVDFTRITVFGVYFSALVYVFTGYLQFNKNFSIPALIGVPYNLFVISSIYVSIKLNTAVLPIGILMAIISQLVILLPSVYKKGFRYKPIFHLNDENIRSITKLALPVILGTSVNQINKLVDRTIASQIAVGGISILNYTNRLVSFVLVLFATSVATVIYPTISKLATENNIKGLKKSLSEAISVINLLVIPTTIGAMVFAEPIVRLLFGRGAFDSQAISMTSYALFFYSTGMIGYGLREVLSRAFYSLQDTKTPMINAAVAVILNIILNIILSKFLGLGGLALATSISAIFCTILLLISLRKKIGPFGMKSTAISFIKIICASLLMGIIAKLLFNYLIITNSQNLSLIVSISVGALVYFITVYFMKIKDVDIIINAIKRKMKKTTI